jgi:hypothetical protein
MAIVETRMYHRAKRSLVTEQRIEAFKNAQNHKKDIDTCLQRHTSPSGCPDHQSSGLARPPQPWYEITLNIWWPKVSRVDPDNKAKRFTSNRAFQRHSAHQPCIALQTPRLDLPNSHDLSTSWHENPDKQISAK